MGKKILNSNGARTQLCFTPFVTSKDLEESPESITLADMPSWKDIMMLITLLGQPTVPHFLYLPGCEYHISGSSTRPKATLTLW